MFVRWYRKREKSDEREESLDEIWRGERRMKRGQLEREWRRWPERNKKILMGDNYWRREVRRGDSSTWGADREGNSK